jgi:hypothetical protein
LKILGQFYPFFLLFAPVHTQDAQIRSAAHKVQFPWPCSAFTPATVPQDHPHATERIDALRFAQQRKITLKIFLEVTDHLKYFNPLTTTQVPVKFI